LENTVEGYLKICDAKRVDDLAKMETFQKLAQTIEIGLGHGITQE
jgi:hypothetical protein